MKRAKIIIVALLVSIVGFAQEVKVEFFTPSIVHIVKGQPTKTLVITAKPDNVHVTRKGNTWTSSELIVRQDAKGNLTFLTSKGKVLLREKSCDINKVSQTFTLDKDEAIYGLGTIQNGKIEFYARSGKDTPAGLVVDREGNTMTDSANILTELRAGRAAFPRASFPVPPSTSWSWPWQPSRPVERARAG